MCVIANENDVWKIDPTIIHNDIRENDPEAIRETVKELINVVKAKAKMLPITQKIGIMRIATMGNQILYEMDGTKEIN